MTDEQLNDVIRRILGDQDYNTLTDEQKNNIRNQIRNEARNNDDTITSDKVVDISNNETGRNFTDHTNNSSGSQTGNRTNNGSTTTNNVSRLSNDELDNIIRNIIGKENYDSLTDEQKDNIRNQIRNQANSNGDTITSDKVADIASQVAGTHFDDRTATGSGTSGYGQNSDSSRAQGIDGSKSDKQSNASGSNKTLNGVKELKDDQLDSIIKAAIGSDDFNKLSDTDKQKIREAIRQQAGANGDTISTDDIANLARAATGNDKIGKKENSPVQLTGTKEPIQNIGSLTDDQIRDMITKSAGDAVDGLTEEQWRDLINLVRA
jgi:mono/diheme cytochrome c family protein